MEYVANSISESKIPIHCPTPGCAQELSQHEVRCLVNEAVFNQFLALEFKTSAFVTKNLVSCPSINCPGMIEPYDAGAREEAECQVRANLNIMVTC